MVPLWDALNHVTGRANVRLHHCERSATLQMIATADIHPGQEVSLRNQAGNTSDSAPGDSAVCKPTDAT